MSSSPSFFIPEDFPIYKDSAVPRGQTLHDDLPAWLIPGQNKDNDIPTLTSIRHAESVSNMHFELFGRVFGALNESGATAEALFIAVILPLIIGYIQMRPNHDHALHPLGIKSADRLGQALFQACQKSENTPTHVHCSPFLRTRQSMVYALRHILDTPSPSMLLDTPAGETHELTTRFNTQIQITIDDRLREVDPENTLHLPGWASRFIKTHKADIVGWLNAQPVRDICQQSEVSPEEIWGILKSPIPQERTTQFQGRLNAVLDDMAQKPGHTLVWSHGDPIKGMIAHALGIETDGEEAAIDAFGKIRKIPNSSLTTFAFLKNTWELTGMGIMVPKETH